MEMKTTGKRGVHRWGGGRKHEGEDEGEIEGGTWKRVTTAEKRHSVYWH